VAVPFAAQVPDRDLDPPILPDLLGDDVLMNHVPREPNLGVK